MDDVEIYPMPNKTMNGVPAAAAILANDQKVAKMINRITTGLSDQISESVSIHIQSINPKH